MPQNNNNIPFMVYQVLEKDKIRNEILPHLSVAKRGFQTTSCLIELVNSILYKLKAGCQWHILPVDGLFSCVVLSYKTVFEHFRKCCKTGEWEYSWIKILTKYKSVLDLSSADLDGTISQLFEMAKKCLIRDEKKGVQRILYI